MADASFRQKWDLWSDITSLVDTAWGLTLLSDYGCAKCISDREEFEAAQAASMTAASMLLRRAKDMLVEIEPKTNREGATS